MNKPQMDANDQDANERKWGLPLVSWLRYENGHDSDLAV
jgi:hypothetical protein